ncbi:MAG: insulinase family protein [Thermoflavifilum sp.]|nr:insulinase family protein [Thermoflavifilum sp.]
MPSVVDRTLRPLIHEPVEFEVRLKPYKLIRLDNGIPVYLLSASHYETFSLEVVFPAGDIYASQVLEAAATNRLMQMGTQQHNAQQIHETIEFYGAYLQHYTGPMVAGYSLLGLSKHLPNLLPILHEILTEPVFPEEEIALYRQNQKQRLRIDMKKSDVVADRLIDEMLFGSQHPYGWHEQEGDYDAVHRDMLLAFHRKHYILPAAKIFLAGKVEDQYLSLLNQYFGQAITPDVAPQAQVPAAQPAAVHRLQKIIDEQALQAAVRLGRIAPGPQHPDSYLLKLLNAVWGGYFGSRLMSNIREEKGYTYGIHAVLYSLDPETASWIVSAEVGKDVADATTTEIFREMNKLSTELIPEEELQVVKNYLIGVQLGRLDGPFEQMQKWKSLILMGQDEADFARQITVFKTATAEDLIEVARRYFVPEMFYEVKVF